MSTDEKDRLGNKLRDVERAREDQYFAQRDRELLERARRAKAGEMEAASKDAAHVHCPKCGTHLQRQSLHGVSVDECTSCHGVWLDHGELQELGRREDQGWIARWLRQEFKTPE